MLFKFYLKMYRALSSVARNFGVQYVNQLHRAGSGIRTGDCIVLCVARNAGVQYVHLLHLGRLWYSHT